VGSPDRRYIVHYYLVFNYICTLKIILVFIMEDVRILKVPARLSLSHPGVNDPISPVVTFDIGPRSFVSSGVLQVNLCHSCLYHLFSLLVAPRFALLQKAWSS